MYELLAAPAPSKVLPLVHLLNATSNATLETSDLRYFSVVDVQHHPTWWPITGAKLLFFARRSVRGPPGALPVLRSLTTWLLGLSGPHSTHLTLLSDRPVVEDYALASNLDVVLFANSSNRHGTLYALGGHHLKWDERKGYSQLGRHHGSRLQPRDGLHLLRASSLQQVTAGAWMPWNQSLPTVSPLRAHRLRASESALAAAIARGSMSRKDSIVISGRHPGCQEVFNRYAPVCFFDSKMSLARFRGRYLVFARANLAERGGGRFVQVAGSVADDPAGPYGPFKLVEVSGYRALRQGNVYTAAVREHPLDADMLMGLFSVNEGVAGKVNRDGRCYIALALSCDGHHWSKFVPLLSTAGMRGRTFDQPVGGLVYRDSNVHFFVHRDVPQISQAAPTASRLERYTFDAAALLRFTTATKAELACAKA